MLLVKKERVYEDFFKINLKAAKQQLIRQGAAVLILIKPGIVCLVIWQFLLFFYFLPFC